MENVILENALLKASQEGYEDAYQYQIGRAHV